MEKGTVRSATRSLCEGPDEALITRVFRAKTKAHPESCYNHAVLAETSDGQVWTLHEQPSPHGMGRILASYIVDVGRSLYDLRVTSLPPRLVERRTTRRGNVFWMPCD